MGPVVCRLPCALVALLALSALAASIPSVAAQVDAFDYGPDPTFWVDNYSTATTIADTVNGTLRLTHIAGTDRTSYFLISKDVPKVQWYNVSANAYTGLGSSSGLMYLILRSNGTLLRGVDNNRYGIPYNASMQFAIRYFGTALFSYGSDSSGSYYSPYDLILSNRNITFNRWYDLAVNANWENYTFKFYVDNELQFTYISNSSWLDWVGNSIKVEIGAQDRPTTVDKVVYFDNFTMSAPEEPEEPEPGATVYNLTVAHFTLTSTNPFIGEGSWDGTMEGKLTFVTHGDVNITSSQGWYLPFTVSHYYQYWTNWSYVNPPDAIQIYGLPGDAPTWVDFTLPAGGAAEDPGSDNGGAGPVFNPAGNPSGRNQTQPSGGGDQQPVTGTTPIDGALNQITGGAYGALPPALKTVVVTSFAGVPLMLLLLLLVSGRAVQKGTGGGHG